MDESERNSVDEDSENEDNQNKKGNGFPFIENEGEQITQSENEVKDDQRIQTGEGDNMRAFNSKMVTTETKEQTHEGLKTHVKTRVLNTDELSAKDESENEEEDNEGTERLIENKSDDNGIDKTRNGSNGPDSKEENFQTDNQHTENGESENNLQYDLNEFGKGASIEPEEQPREGFRTYTRIPICRASKSDRNSSKDESEDEEEDDDKTEELNEQGRMESIKGTAYLIKGISEDIRPRENRNDTNRFDTKEDNFQSDNQRTKKGEYDNNLQHDLYGFEKGESNLETANIEIKEQSHKELRTNKKISRRKAFSSNQLSESNDESENEEEDDEDIEPSNEQERRESTKIMTKLIENISDDNGPHESRNGSYEPDTKEEIFQTDNQRTERDENDNNLEHDLDEFEKGALDSETITIKPQEQPQEGVRTDTNTSILRSSNSDRRSSKDKSQNEEENNEETGRLIEQERREYPKIATNLMKNTLGEKEPHESRNVSNELDTKEDFFQTDNERTERDESDNTLQHDFNEFEKGATDSETATIEPKEQPREGFRTYTTILNSDILPSEDANENEENDEATGRVYEQEGINSIKITDNVIKYISDGNGPHESRNDNNRFDTKVDNEQSLQEKYDKSYASEQEDDMTEEKEKCCMDKEQFNKEMNNSQKLVFDLQHKIQTIENERKRLQDENTSLNKEVKRLQMDNETLTADVRQLRVTQNSRHGEQEESMRQIAGRDKIIGDLSIKIDKLEEENKSMKVEAADFTQRLEIQRNEIQRRSEANNEFQIKLNEMAQNYETSRRTIQQKDTNLQKQRESIQNKDRAIAAIKREKENLEDEVKRMMISNTEEKFKFTTHLKRTEGERDKISSELEFLKATKENEIQRVKIELQVLQEKSLQQSAKIERCEMEKKYANECMERTMRDRQEMEYKLQGCQALEMENKRKEEYIQRLLNENGSLNEMLRQTSTFREHVQRYYQTVQTLQVELQRERERNQHLNEYMHNQGLKLDHLTRECNNYRASADSNRNTTDQLKEEKLNLVRQLDKLTNEIEGLKRERDNSAQQMYDLKDQIRKLTEEEQEDEADGDITDHDEENGRHCVRSQSSANNFQAIASNLRGGNEQTGIFNFGQSSAQNSQYNTSSLQGTGLFPFSQRGANTYLFNTDNLQGRHFVFGVDHQK